MGEAVLYEERILPVREPGGYVGRLEKEKTFGGRQGKNKDPYCQVILPDEQVGTVTWQEWDRMQKWDWGLLERGDAGHKTVITEGMQLQLRGLL